MAFLLSSGSQSNIFQSNSTTTMTMAQSVINIMCWNCRGVMSGTPYLVKCLNKYDIDVCRISEHRLREYNSNFLNTIDPNYMAFTTCATERDPSVYRIINKGGVSLLITKISETVY